MRAFISISPIFTTLLLNLLPVQVSHALSKSHSKVMLFHDVWASSLCRSLERMVEVEQEYPGGVEYFFSPGCVLLHRCSGCCSDENLACYPTLTRNITMQLLRITPAERSRRYVELSFMEHHSCECRPRRAPFTSERRGGGPNRRKGRKKGRDCVKCRPPRSIFNGL
ncbi:snake venom vascular endothelial growth factor toxin ICPP [Denticeps clupeoides]|uniref:Platelet-derived growth factor (PDGF) family profile domain-containing protein n=1 Tax=Denticeps clupeoides TaxID=299321 RepID=A0AAY4BWV5_9TELE|nr:snake venom vascular endothelial growth factor toxin ICPP-like [Denticeps clupeoides]